MKYGIMVKDAHRMRCLINSKDWHFKQGLN